LLLDMLRTGVVLILAISYFWLDHRYLMTWISTIPMISMSNSLKMTCFKRKPV
jgi:hypothetical protein